MAKRGIQQRGLDLIFGGKDALEDSVETEEEIPAERREVILFLREGLNPADKNFTKYPNEMHGVMKDNLSEEAEGVLYMYLWRQSWGFGRNYCRVSYSTIDKNTVIGSKRTARRAMAGLIEKRFVIRALAQDREHDVTQEGGLYRILTPREIDDLLTEEAVPLNSIPEEGVVMMAVANMDIEEKASNYGKPTSMVTMAIPNMDSGQTDHSQDGQDRLVKMTMGKTAIPSIDPQNTRHIANGGQHGHSQDGPPFKDKRNIKDSLFPRDIISEFYKGIGQKRVTKIKRERAEKCIEELLNERFNLEDIQLAIQWTLKNSKDDLYDFSIIKHTIGQAIADREKLEAEKGRKLEKEKIAIQEKEAERRSEEELAKLRAHKEELSKGERTELLKKAMDEIAKMEGVKKEFVTPTLIEAKENEILRAELENDG